jgi:hypothetical protein
LLPEFNFKSYLHVRLQEPDTMKSDTKAVAASRLRQMVGASTLICAACVATPAAQAQVFVYPFSSGPSFYSPYPYGPVYAPYARPMRDYRPGPFLSPSEVFEEVLSAGYQPVRLMGRNGGVLIVDAKDRRGKPIRLIIDAMDGDILERFTQERSMKESAPKPKQAYRVDEPAAKTPVPPRRPATALTDGTNPPAVMQPPVAQAPVMTVPPTRAPQKETVARHPNDWAPINSVPPAPLD